MQAAPTCAQHRTPCAFESGLRGAAVDAMPIVVFRPGLPGNALVAGLEKFTNASNINFGGAATDQVLGIFVLHGFLARVILKLINKNVCLAEHDAVGRDACEFKVNANLSFLYLQYRGSEFSVLRFSVSLQFCGVSLTCRAGGSLHKCRMRCE